MSATTSTPPTVSVGLPVYNGERFLDSTLGSILAQDHADFELIVSDNASTDATAAICAAHAARDPRVIYHRQPRNLGAGPNYDTCFHMARGRYFKWAAHDDMLAPDFLSRSIAALDANPRAIHCTTGITEIDAQGQVLRTFANRFPGIDSDRPAHRFAAMIHTTHQCEDFFGVFRREALIGTALHGTYNGSDRVLLAEMALRGPWVHVEAPVFLHREHPFRYTRALLLKDQHQASTWLDTAASRRIDTQFHWNLWRQYWRIFERNPLSPDDRRACEAELWRWWLTDGHAADVVRDFVRSASPRVFGMMRAVKRATLGSAGPTQPGALPPAQ